MADDDHVRDLCAGREEWHVRKGDGIVMYFDRRDSLNPEREARQWLAEHQRDYPERFAGYEVERAVVQSPLQRMAMALLDERDALAADRERLDWLEERINVDGEIHLHDGAHARGTGLGLRPGTMNRTLRQAIDTARGKA